MRSLRSRISDSRLFALRSAARAAIVVPAVFAFADGVIGQPETTLFAGFGGIAMLVFVDFGGPWRMRLTAYLGLAATGAATITLGTLCSQLPVVAVIAMALVGFAVIFSSGISGYFAAAQNAALLTFILPVAIPAPASAIPDRLEGWGLAALMGISAAMLLWPAHPRDMLRAAAARASNALADLVGSDPSGSRSQIEQRTEAARAAIGELRRSFVQTPYRPTGPTGAAEALAFLIDGLDWLLLVASPRSDGIRQSGVEPCREENLEVVAAAVAVLRSSAATLEGGEERPDIERLVRAQERVSTTLARRVEDLHGSGDGAALEASLSPSFRIREISNGTAEIGANALVASGAAPQTGRARSAVAETGRLLREQATVGSAWFRNALRGAAGLAAAVAVIEVVNPQNGFWVVLATLSVLRSNALGTGSNALRALAGTAVGILVGGLLVAAIGSDQAVLWAVLPLAILLAAYAPRAISFAAGQAGFTVVVLIIFNLISPTGWQTGLVRVEDVAMGCAISLVVAALFWPRGARGLLRRNLGAAYARAIDYVASATRRLVEADRPGDAVDLRLSAGASARAAADRLDGAFRQYLTEVSPPREGIESAARLVAGVTRLRLAGDSVSTLAAAPEAKGAFDSCANAVAADLDELSSWYHGFGDALVAGEATAPPEFGLDRTDRVGRCVSEALAAGDPSALAPALNLLWASRHIETLRRLAGRLVEPADDLSGDEVPAA